MAGVTPGGRWEPVRELGRGGMGTVWEVRDPQLPERRLALKRVRADLADAECVLRFVREAQLLARVRHPGVLRVHEAGSDAGGPFLLTELVEGETLQALVAGGGAPPARAAELVAAVCDAVEALHGAGVVHRDLKPENVLLRREDGRPVLLDFGLARELDAAGLTRTGELLGTPAYMAPEQARDPRAVDARADVYSLGALLYALSSGRPPFSGGALAVLAAQARGPAWPASPDPALDAVCRRAMAPDPARRFSSAAELGAALRDLPGGSGGARAVRRGLLVGGVTTAALLAALALRSLLAASGPAPAGPAGPPSRPALRVPEPAPALPRATPVPAPTPRVVRDLPLGPGRVAAWRELCATQDSGGVATDAARAELSRLEGEVLAQARRAPGPLAACWLEGGRVALADASQLVVWDPAREEAPPAPRRTRAGGSALLAVLDSPGGLVALWPVDERVELRGLERETLRELRPAEGAVTMLEADPRRELALLATPTRVFLLGAEGLRRELPVPGLARRQTISGLAWSPGGERCAVVWGGQRKEGELMRAGSVAWFDRAGELLGQRPWTNSGDRPSAVALPARGDPLLGLTGGPLARATGDGLRPLSWGAPALGEVYVRTDHLQLASDGRLFVTRSNPSADPLRQRGQLALLTPAEEGLYTERALQPPERARYVALALAPGERELLAAGADGRVVLLATPAR